MTIDLNLVAAADNSQAATHWDKAAAGWDRHAPEIRNWLRVATDAMIEMAGINPGDTVLDVAAGAGDQTLDIARRVGTKGRVVASDISPGTLKHAFANVAAAGYQNVRIHCADAAQLGLEDAAFDAAVSRLGLMFLSDPLQGLREVLRVLKPGGRFCSIVFAGPESNPCLRILMSTAMRHAGKVPSDPFRPGGLVSLGKPGLIDALFNKAGFRAVATTRIDAPFRLPATKDYMAFVRDAAGPILQILAPLSEAARADAWADIAAELEVYQTENGWIGPNTLLLTSG
ncbi:class I SAM-dependent methyltransferase, partial [Phaeovulum sp.]|uniref:class I SAM-dependent methyltransferase n=1 Tax=Phaeovulum sp. TaxID=2934796 RepID=UPI0035663D66